MSILYSFFIQFYGVFILLSSFFNKKAKKWTLGRENWQNQLSEKINKKDNYCWLHCASAGEFEQAIPLINRIKNQESGIKTKIAVSFFSPSGFEMYKNADLADLFFYFPLDTQQNAAKLIAILNPSFVIFIRNEIWRNTLVVLKNKNIASYLVNANLKQKRSIFYQYYLNKIYPLFTKIFDTKAFGNTKLERVVENKNEIYEDKILEDFCNNSFVVILGSCWQKEEKYMAEFYKKNNAKNKQLKIIIAPHEYDETKLNTLENLFSQKITSYSDYPLLSTNSSLLYLDKKGILKYAYRYTDIAFIGGGFEKTVHNVSEAAVYEIPTLFGPNYTTFDEVIELVNLSAAFSVCNFLEFENQLLYLINDVELRSNIRHKLNTYFLQQEKTSQKIISEILE